MTLPATTGTHGAVPEITSLERGVLRYDPRMIASHPGNFVQALRIAGRKTNVMLFAAPLGTIMGAVGGAATAAVTAIATHMLGGNGDLVQTLAIVAGAGGGISSTMFMFHDLVDTYVGEKTRNAIERVDEMTSVCIDPSSMEAMKAARMLTKAKPRDLDRAALIRLDVVATALLATIEKAGPDDKLVAAARTKAERAVCSIMASVRTADPHLPAIEAERLLDQVCSSVMGRPSVVLQAPNARVSRILSLAEQALASHPHIVDASGARLDRLIREHVPLLLTLREEAIRTAPANALDAVDESFQLAFDGVAASIEEAMASIHDDAMDRLTTQVRFLSARRGGDMLLTSID